MQHYTTFAPLKKYCIVIPFFKFQLYSFTQNYIGVDRNIFSSAKLPIASDYIAFFCMLVKNIPEHLVGTCNMFKFG